MTNEDIAKDPPPKASFLGIPVELRLRIYEVTFRNDELLVQLHGRSDGQTYISKAVTGPLVLKRVSRAVASEIKTVLPSICDIHFSLKDFDSDDAIGWLQYMGNEQRTLREAKKSYGLCLRSITIDLHKFDVKKNGSGLNALRQCFVADTCHGTFDGSSWDRETTKCGINDLRRTMNSILNPVTGSASLDRTKVMRIMGTMLYDYSSNRAQKNWNLFVRKGMAVQLAEQEQQGTSIVTSRGNRQHVSVNAAEPFLVPEPRVFALTEEHLAQYDDYDRADSKLEAHSSETEAKHNVVISVQEDDIPDDEVLADSRGYTRKSEHIETAWSRISKAFRVGRLISWLRPT